MQIAQTLQVFTEISKTESIYKKVIKMPSWKPWLMRPSGLIKRGMKHKRF